MAKSLGRSSLVFSAFTMLSRLLGLLRDMLLARHFDSTITDPFFAALRIPNTLRRFFAEGSFTNAFVPVFTEVKEHNPAELAELLRRVCGTLLVLLLTVTALGVLFSGTVLALVAGGLTGHSRELAREMLPIMFPYILLISLTALASSVLNSFQIFAVPAFTPCLLNLTLIGASLWHRPENHGLELAWAVLLGGILQLAIQLPSLRRLGLLLRPKWGWHYGGVRKIFRLMLPTLFGSSVGQLTVLINTALASALATGSISWLYYADRLVELPVALIGVAIGVVILPRLSALKNQPSQRQFQLTLNWALRWGLLLGSAAAVGLSVAARPLVLTLFQRGKFDNHDVLMTTHALEIYGLGAFFLIMVKILAPAFYARQDTRTPVKAGLVAMTINMVLAFPLSHFYQHVGLAAATTIASFVNMTLLLQLLRPLQFSRWFLLRVVLANGVLVLVLLWLQGRLFPQQPFGSWERLLRLMALVALAMASYVATLYGLGLRPRHLRLGKIQ